MTKAQVIRAIMLKNVRDCTREELQTVYLDYYNEFISTHGFAAYYDVDIDNVSTFLDAGRVAHYDMLAEGGDEC